MGRKPNKRVSLTDAEFNVVNKVAHWTKVDESWFYLCDRDFGDGHGEHTVVWDMERSAYISLQFGLRLLRESFGGNEEYFVKDGPLGRKELEVWRGVFERAF